MADRVDRIISTLDLLPIGIQQLIQFLECWPILAGYSDYLDDVGEDRFSKLKSSLSKDFKAKIGNIDSCKRLTADFKIEKDASLLSFFTMVGCELVQNIKDRIDDFQKNFPRSLMDWETIYPLLSQVSQELNRFKKELTDSSFQSQFEKDPVMATFLIALADGISLQLPFLSEFRLLFSRLEVHLRKIGGSCVRAFSLWKRGPLDKRNIPRTLVESCRTLFCTVNSSGRNIVQTRFLSQDPLVIVDEGILYVVFMV
jgi:hypothetical protein